MNYYKNQLDSLGQDVQVKLIGEEGSTNWLTLNDESVQALTELFCARHGADLLIETINNYINESLGMFELKPTEKARAIELYRAMLNIK